MANNNNSSLAHTFNEVLFNDATEAESYLKLKASVPGEVSIAYYRDLNAESGVNAMLSIGPSMQSDGNIIIKNLSYIEDALNNQESLTKVKSQMILDLIQEDIEALYNMINNIDTKVCIKVKYEELCQLKNDAALVSGNFYRITDYVCTSTQEYTQAVKYFKFDIIVQALSESILDEHVKICEHDYDPEDPEDYQNLDFRNCHLTAWDVKYTLENNDDKFAWADTENGKGVIYYMKDDWGNEIPFDFLNIKVIPFNVLPDNDSTKVSTINEGEYYHVLNSGKDYEYSTGNGIVRSGYTTIKPYIGEDGRQYLNRIWIFIPGNAIINIGDNCTNISIDVPSSDIYNMEYFSTYEAYKNNYPKEVARTNYITIGNNNENIISRYSCLVTIGDNNLNICTFSSKLFTIGNNNKNIIDMWGNTGNTYGNNCENIFVPNSVFNTFENNVVNIEFNTCGGVNGNYFESFTHDINFGWNGGNSENYFKKGSNNIQLFGGGISNNTFGENVYAVGFYNTSDGCHHNVFGNNTHNINFDRAGGAFNNTFGEDCHDIGFNAGGIHDNILGNNCYYIEISGALAENIFEDNCTNIKMNAGYRCLFKEGCYNIGGKEYSDYGSMSNRQGAVTDVIFGKKVHDIQFLGGGHERLIIEDGCYNLEFNGGNTDNKFCENCHDITFMNGGYNHNIIERDCYDIHLSGEVLNNNIYKNCHGITSTDVLDNTIIRDNSSNFQIHALKNGDFGYSCKGITIGTYGSQNPYEPVVTLKIGDYSLDITVEYGSKEIAIGDNCSGISLRGDYNTILDNCKGITLNDSINNVIQNNCTGIQISAGANNNRIADRCAGVTITGSINNNIGDSCTDIELSGNASNNVINNCCKNIKLSAGAMNNVIGANTRNVDMHNGTHNNIIGTSCNNSLQLDPNGNPNNYNSNGEPQPVYGTITLKEGCHNNVIEDRCTNVSFESGCMSNVVGISCENIKIKSGNNYNINNNTKNATYGF